MKYRKEIDGLRAVAVVPVIFFHAGFEIFSGGFVGVDVFFVISGYLITSLILQERESEVFTLVGFYERRARRILPALFLVMFACIPFAWIWMVPNEAKEFSRSLVATVFFVSNIFFYRQSGYFDTAAELKPLLHTWSLAVEEQYYLVFPLLFLPFFWRRGQHWILGVLIALGLGSLTLATIGSIKMPAASFYLLPTRFWELVVGAFVAFGMHAHVGPRGWRGFNGLTGSQVGSCAGLILIATSIFTFDSSTPFPGLYALLPTMGTALVILFARPPTIVGKILSSRFLVAIGLISYSSYLWHQPLFAFFRLRSIEPPSSGVLLTLSCASLLLAYFSWRYVERPFRERTRFSKRTVFKSSVVASSIVVILAFSVYLTSEINARHPHLPSDYFEHTWIHYETPGVDGNRCHLGLAQTCVVNKSPTSQNRYLLFGDSHSLDFTGEFSEFLRSNELNGSQLSIGGCAFLESQSPSQNGECGKARSLLAKFALEQTFDSYVLVGNFVAYTRDATKTERHADIKSFVSLITLILDSGANLYFFKPRVTWSANPVKAAALDALDKLRVTSYGVDNQNDWEVAIRNLSRNRRFHVFDQNDALSSAGCGSKLCFKAHSRDMYPLFRDRSHLTSIGAHTVFDAFRAKNIKDSSVR